MTTITCTFETGDDVCFSHQADICLSVMQDGHSNERAEAAAAGVDH